MLALLLLLHCENGDFSILMKDITVVPISRGKEIFFSLRTSPFGLHLDIKNCGLCTGVYDGALLLLMNAR